VTARQMTERGRERNGVSTILESCAQRCRFDRSVMDPSILTAFAIDRNANIGSSLSYIGTDRQVNNDRWASDTPPHLFNHWPTGVAQWGRTGGHCQGGGRRGRLVSRKPNHFHPPLNVVEENFKKKIRSDTRADPDLLMHIHTKLSTHCSKMCCLTFEYNAAAAVPAVLQFLPR